MVQRDDRAVRRRRRELAFEPGKLLIREGAVLLSRHGRVEGDDPQAP